MRRHGRLHAQRAVGRLHRLGRAAETRARRVPFCPYVGGVNIRPNHHRGKKRESRDGDDQLIKRRRGRAGLDPSQPVQPSCTGLTLASKPSSLQPPIAPLDARLEAGLRPGMTSGGGSAELTNHRPSSDPFPSAASCRSNQAKSCFHCAQSENRSTSPAMIARPALSSSFARSGWRDLT